MRGHARGGRGKVPVCLRWRRGRREGSEVGVESREAQASYGKCCKDCSVSLSPGNHSEEKPRVKNGTPIAASDCTFSTSVACRSRADSPVNCFPCSAVCERLPAERPISAGTSGLGLFLAPTCFARPGCPRVSCGDRW